jgi:glutathione S-transferase
MSTLTLTYWNKRGRGEQVRLLLHALNEPYTEKYVAKGPQFKALQAQGPSKLMFGSVPLLEDGDFSLCQGPVILSYLAKKHGLLPDDPGVQARADAIAWGAEDLRIRYFGLFGPNAEEKQRAFVDGDFKSRWLPAFEGLLQLNQSEAHFVGDGLTHADVAVWDVLDSMLQWVSGASLEGQPRLMAFFDGFKARPEIAAYLESEDRPQG